MSKLTENKSQIIHIACEAVVLCGLVFHFSSKNKKLMEHIEGLAHRVEEHEDNIQKLEQAIGRLAQQQHQFVTAIPQPNIQQSYPLPTRKTKRVSRRKVKHVSPPLEIEPIVQKSNTKVQFEESNTEISSSTESESDSDDLDEELQEELSELEDNLKKE